MTELRLSSLKLRNFKGIRDLTITPGGGDADVFGDNATGKTTLFDAFLWLLFDKDSQNKKDFSIKTLAATGAVERHGFEHEVEGVLNLDSKTLTLRKAYYERWTKKRGSAERTFEGHTTDYYIDGVPAKKSEYTARVAEICDEGVFRLLTDPSYFNQVMRWTDRRALLLEVCGDITEADVIASDIALAKLPDVLAGRSIDDHRKVIAARRATINKELERIPVRIDEVSQGLPEVAESRGSIESSLKKIRTTAQDKHQERARLKAGGQVAEKRRQLSEAKAELQMIENAAQAKADEERRAAQQAAGDLTYRIDTLTQKIERHENTIASNLNTVRRLEADMEKLREKWRTIDAETFEKDMEEHDTVCYACGQDLPAEQIEAARQKALAAFNRSKAEGLEKIDAEGKETKQRAGELSLDNERLRKEIQELEAERDKLAEKKANAPAIEDVPVSLPAEHASTEEEISKLEAEIASLGEGNTEALATVDAEIADLKAQISELEAKLAQVDQREKSQERIRELAAKERELAAEFERLEKELHLCETFIKTKVGLLEEKINAKFQLARFKLFEVQINEGVKECCETLVNGVPYSDLNNGSRINVGLDIINTLSEYYGFTAPIFVDNAEAVTALSDTRGQLIRLVVSGADKDLRVETKTALKEAI
ncbi:MAG: AAA family ATPase [Thermoleophilia bacterium]|nr:AAA family ATPase [Thermoleophilia bacterium]